MEKRKYSSVKECDAYESDIIYEFSAGNYDIPKGDIFDPLVQKLIAKRCEDRGFNILFELEEPYKEDIKYVVFTKKGARLYFTSKCKKEALTMLKSENIKAWQLSSVWSEYTMYLVSTFNDTYLFDTIGEPDIQQICPSIVDVTIDRSEKITGLAESTLTDIESEEPSLLDELKSDKDTEVLFNPKYADYLSELYLLGAKGMLEDLIEFYGKMGNEIDCEYIEDLILCFSALYTSNLIRGIESKKAYQIATDSLSFCLGKKIVLSEFEPLLDPEGFNMEEVFEDLVFNEPYDILKWGLKFFAEDSNTKNAEACKKLLVGYNALYQLEGYSESDSRVFAISRLSATKFFSEQLILDCF